MSVSIKTEHEIELMREAGHLLEKVHDGLIPYIKPGVSTKLQKLKNWLRSLLNTECLWKQKLVPSVVKKTVL